MNPPINKFLFCVLALPFVLLSTRATYAVDGCSSTSFNIATAINLEGGPFGMAVADFNGDGHLDLAVSPNNGSNEVILLLGRGGAERFGPPLNFSAGGPPRRLTAADFNGDGKPDLAVSIDDVPNSFFGNLAILLNDGTGKFGAPNLITTPGDPIQPVAGDVNNDGKLDIVTGLSTGTTDGNVAILLGNGAGGFTQAANSPIATFSSITLPVLGDFNEDGKLDFAIPGRSNTGGVDIRLGNGAGGFGDVINIATGAFSFFVLPADFNKDGHLDLLHGSRMVFGTGTGTFGSPITIPIPTDDSVALAGDVNNDGNLDVVTGGGHGLTILLGNGTGNMVRGKSYISGFITFGAGSSFALLGDFNEDGKPDLAAAQRSGVGILDGDGTGSFTDASSYHATISSPQDILVADFNNDGKQDFAAVSPAGGFPSIPGVEVALGDGAGNFTKKSVTSFPTSSLSGITAADLNNDGKLDLAITRPVDGRVFLLLNDGTGGFPANGDSAPFLFIGFEPRLIKSGDFNNDSKADLVVVTTSNFVVLLGDGSGTGYSNFGGQSLPGGFASDLGIGDFNADSKPDLAIIKNGANEVRVFAGDGTGIFTSYATLSLAGTPGSLVVKDLNGDSKSDIAVTSAVFDGIVRQNRVTVFLNNGAGGFTAGADYPTDGTSSLEAGNFNNDSSPDLIVLLDGFQSNSSVFGVSVLTNKGNGQFNASIVIPVGQQAAALAAGDFNGDNKDDVVLAEFSQTIAVLLNNFTAAQPCLSVNDASVTETDSGTIDATFTVTLSAASAQTVRVNFFARSFFTGSSAFTPATKGADFEDVPGTVTFLPGETTKNVVVPVKGDLIDEPDQLFSVNLTTPINAHISDSRGLGTIVDNDGPASISIDDVSFAEGTSTNFTVSLNSPSEKTITVQFALAPGTATANTDYGSFSGTVEFPVGAVSRTISVSSNQDLTFEPDETFFVNLSNPTNATIADAQGQGTITNNDPQPGISMGSSFRTEGAQGTSGDATFQVLLSNPSYQTITVAYATANGTATAGSDYVATSGTVTFNPGETTKSFVVSVLGDDVDEQHETYFVNLSNPTNATITAAQGTGTIADDDGPTISISNASVTEGNSGLVNAVFTISLSGTSVQDVFVNFATAAGTATSGVDFQSVFSGFAFIPAGQTSTTVTVRVFADILIEPDETFTVTLQFPNNATIAPGQGTGTGTIVNDDSNGKLQFSAATYTTSEGAGTIVIQVNRVDGVTGAISVDYATSNGTATAGSDYTASSGTLTFAEREIAKAFFIPITADNVDEVPETVNLTLSNPTGGATLGNPSTAVLTIQAATPLLVFEDSGPNPSQLAALDSLLFLRDPFAVIRPFDLFNQGSDKNTRVILFVTNLQLAQGEPSSAVVVNLVDSNGLTYDVPAQDVRAIPGFDFTQVLFRLPDNLSQGVCNIKLKVHGLESNQGTIRIKQ